MLVCDAELIDMMCPLAAGGKFDDRREYMCGGSRCMAWRYADRTAPAVGYCGMAPIKPEITLDAIAQARGQG